MLRWRQGFGRLVRHKNDTGIVIACDKRLLTKRYGPGFLRALPAPHKVVMNKEQLIKLIRESPLMKPTAQEVKQNVGRAHRGAPHETSNKPQMNTD